MFTRVLSLRSATKIVALISLASLFFAVANWRAERVHAANFTSTQSGSWGSAATWGGAGIPGCGDNVTIANGHTVTLDTTRCANNLTINGGGALDLAGSEMDFSGNGTTFTNNGTVNNTGGFNRILFNVTGNLTQTLSGTGNYSGTLKLQLFSNVGQPATFNVAPGTSLNFSNGTGNGNDHNIEFGGGPTVNVTNALTVIAPSSGNYVNLSNSATMSGAGGLKTQGHVKIVSNGDIAAPVEIVSGAALAEGTSSGNWTVDSGASLSLTNTLNLSGNMTIPSGATVDLAAGEIDFSGTGTTFTNNGTVNSTGTFKQILFNVTGNLTQTLSGTGNYSGTLKLQLFANVGGPGTLNVAPGTSLNFSNGTGNGNDHNIEFGGGPTVNVTNALTVIAPSSGNYVNLSNSGTMSGAGGLKTQGHVKIVSNGSGAAPVEIVSSAALAEGTSSGNWMVDSGASLSLTNTLNLSGNMTIASGATVDLVGGEMDFSGTGTTFTNNGTVNNTGGFTRILFNVTGNLTQTLSGTGTYGPLKLEFFANVGGPGTINVASGTSLNFTNGTGNGNDHNIQIDGGPTLNFIGSGSLTLSNSVSNSGTIIINGGGAACGDATKILIRSNVPGTQRAWSGGGTFSMTDVDAKDQAGTANITVTGGVNSGNNGANWTFVPCASTVQFSAANFDVMESNGSALIDVTRIGDTSGAASVDFKTGNNAYVPCNPTDSSNLHGQATQNCDFIAIVTTVSFAASETSKQVTVPIIDDAYIEGNETFPITLSNPVGATLGAQSSATVTIVDNDTVNLTSPLPHRFGVNFTGGQETPPNNSSGFGQGYVLLNQSETSAVASLQFSNLTSSETAAHIHGPGGPGVAAPILFPLPTTNPVTDFAFSPTTQQVADLKAGLHYMNIHSTNFLNGEIRGQLLWNPSLEVNFLVREQYLDFLSREPDQGGFNFWVDRLNSCPGGTTLQSGVQCFHDNSIVVSNAFVFEFEFQQTGSYTYRLYRIAYGNSQPFPNPGQDTNPPGVMRAAQIPSYAVFVADRSRVIGSPNLAQASQDLATLFVARPEFTNKYGTGLTGPQFVDALLSTVQTDLGVSLTSERQALIDQFNNAGGGNAGRGVVLFRLAQDDTVNNPINNRPLIDAEYNRAFVVTQYFGFLRRDGDLGGLNFWLGQVNNGTLRDPTKQNGMVCSFISSAEYQFRFGPNAPRTNRECPQ